MTHAETTLLSSSPLVALFCLLCSFGCNACGSAPVQPARAGMTPQAEEEQTTTPQEQEEAGLTSTAPMDLDGDGRSDFVILASHNGAEVRGFGRPRYEGLVQVWLSRTGETQTLRSPTTSAHFGGRRSVSGDFNGDGLTDLLLSGTVMSVVYGSASTELSVESWGEFPSVDTATGDVNGDGFDDLVVLATTSGNRSIGVYYGSAEGLSTERGSTLHLPRDFIQDHSRVWVAELTGDGIEDIVLRYAHRLRMHGYDWTINGYAIYQGGANGPSERPSSRVFPPELPTAPLGYERDSDRHGVGGVTVWHDRNGQGRIITTAPKNDTYALYELSYDSSVADGEPNIGWTWRILLLERLGTHLTGVHLGDLTGDGLGDMAIRERYGSGITVLLSAEDGLVGEPIHLDAPEGVQRFYSGHYRINAFHTTGPGLVLGASLLGERVDLTGDHTFYVLQYSEGDGWDFEGPFHIHVPEPNEGYIGFGLR